jgi:hypothetical protein
LAVSGNKYVVTGYKDSAGSIFWQQNDWDPLFSPYYGLCYFYRNYEYYYYDCVNYYIPEGVEITSVDGSGGALVVAVSFNANRIMTPVWASSLVEDASIAFGQPNDIGITSTNQVIITGFYTGDPVSSSYTGNPFPTTDSPTAFIVSQSLTDGSIIWARWAGMSRSKSNDTSKCSSDITVTSRVYIHTSSERSSIDRRGS